MALTPSTMLALGTQALDFELMDVCTGKKTNLFSLKKSSGLLVMFICRHCPYVKHLERELARLGKDYANSNIGIAAVSSNDAEKYPDDAPEQLKKMAEALSFSFPFLYDETQSAAKGYRAACTPDFFLLDSNSNLFYRGQFDDSRPGNGLKVTGADLRFAMDVLTAGKKLQREQKPSLGCNIKWKQGNEPEYFSG